MFVDVVVDLVEEYFVEYVEEGDDGEYECCVVGGEIEVCDVWNDVCQCVVVGIEGECDDDGQYLEVVVVQDFCVGWWCVWL